MSSITKIWNNNSVRIREDDRYVCLSDLAKASGKHLKHWNENKSTHEYLQALGQAVGKPTGELIQIQNGKPTYAHPKVALRFAQWCSPQLAVQVDFWLDELLTTGSVTLKPKTALELAKEQVKLLEQIELQEQQLKLLEADNERQAEAIDELYEYSSIIRVAKFNKCSEKAFSWRKLKAASIAMDLEIKKVPCPRYETKNLYSHEAWRYAYSSYRLPETTTLVINQD